MLICPKCRFSSHGLASFCESCGESLVSQREGDDAIEAMLLKEARKGMWALGAVAVLQAGGALVLDPNNWVLWTFAGVFAVLAIWARIAPLIASAVGLSAFTLLHLADAVVDPSQIYKGIIMKVIVITVLIGAVKAALKHRAFRQERVGA